MRIERQPFDLAFYLVPKGERGSRILGRYVIDYRLKVRVIGGGPDQLHELDVLPRNQAVQVSTLAIGDLLPLALSELGIAAVLEASQ